MSTIEFNTQLIQFRNPLKYFAISLTSNRDDADDLLQDTLVKAIRYRDKFTDATNLKAWLFTIMKNTFINNYRRNSKTQQIVDGSKDLQKLSYVAVSADMSPVTQISYKDIMRQVNQLESDLQIPFQRFYEGFKYKEIADEMNLPIGTVKSRIFLARKKLMEKLQDFR